jgi:hypothetical protein
MAAQHRAKSAPILREIRTRAQIAIQIGPEEWAHVYVHFDGYPA